MLIKYVLNSWFLLFLSHGFSQDYNLNAKIAPDQLKEDFTILAASMQNHHPDLYRFFPKSKFDSLTNVNLNALTDSLTEGEFHVIVRKFTRNIACGHTVALPSKEWYATLRKDIRLIPIQVELKNDQLFIRKVQGELSDSIVNSRILEIDGVPVLTIISELKSIIERDGYGETRVLRHIESSFQTYYSFLYGMKNSYHVVCQTESDQIIESNLEGVKEKVLQKRDDLKIDTVFQTETATFGIRNDSRNQAVIDLTSFPNKGYKKFYKQTFQCLTGMDSVELIIDLRGNGGGYFPNGNMLLRYLMNDKFAMDFSKPNKRSKKSKYLKMNFSSKMTRIIFNSIPDRNKADEARNYQIRYKPMKRNHFDGKIYVLVDGYTFSMGSFLASKLKNGRNAVIIGEETGGGEVGFNATLSWDLELPNSKVRVIIPMYHVAIQPEMEDLGRGVMPNADIQVLEKRE